MNIRTPSKKKIVRTVVVLGVILAVMLTMHILVNYFDLFSFLRSIHGG